MPVQTLQLVKPCVSCAFAFSSSAYRPGRAGRSAVAVAFDEVNARNGRQTPQILQRENQRVIHHPVDQQMVLLRIDVRRFIAVRDDVMQRPVA